MEWGRDIMPVRGRRGRLSSLVRMKETDNLTWCDLKDFSLVFDVGFVAFQQYTRHLALFVSATNPRGTFFFSQPIN